MPLTWYNIAAGNAPWADATSASFSTQTTTANAFSTSSAGFTQTASGVYSTGSTATGYTKDRSTAAGSSYANEFASASIFNLFDRASASGSGRDVGQSGGTSLNVTLVKYSQSFSRTEAGGFTRSNTAGVFLESNGIGFSWSSYYSEDYSLAGNSITRFTSSGYIGQSGTSWSYGSTTASSTFATSSRFESSSSSFSFTIATASVVTSVTETTTTTAGIRVSTTRSTARVYTVSTSTGTLPATSATTRTSSSSYTRATSTAVTSNTTRYSSVTTSYIAGTAHLVPVIRALPSEVLRMHTATGSTLATPDALAGASFTQTTLSDALFSGVQNAPVADSTITRTVSYASVTTANATRTVTAATAVTVTEQVFDGHLPIPASATIERVLAGVTTATLLQAIGGTVLTTSTKTGARSSVSYQLIGLNTVVNETVVGITPTGSTQALAVQVPYVSSFYVTAQDWSGNAGETVSTYRSPAAALFAVSGGGFAGITRMERAGGFQAPAVLGSAAAQGGGLTAGVSFYIGAGNIGTGSPNGLRTPFLTDTTSAVTSDSSYSFSLGSNGVWSVTAASTTTQTSFTASVGLQDVADRFQSASPAGVTRNSVMVAGGAHAYVGGVQQVTFAGGWAWRYTLGDGVGTTSNKALLANSYDTAALGSSIVAAETYRAGVASPALAVGLPTFENRAYSAP